MRHWSKIGLLALLAGVWLGPAHAAEYRAQWADAFHPGYLTAGQVTTMMNNLRTANSNVVIPEVRVYSDSCYFPHPAFYVDKGDTIVAKGTRITCDLGSDPEPHSGAIDANFDALQEVLNQAHAAGKPRLDVWAWLVSFRSGSQLAASHPEWATKNADPTKAQTDFDPGHPGVEQQLFNVCMDLVTNYDIDGLNFDYIRFTDAANGYNPISIQRYNTLNNLTGTPANTDALWKQWRRDQVTAVVRKIYLNAIAIKPNLKITADTICFYPAPARPLASDTNKTQTWKTNFQGTSAAYTSVYQDWRSWMEEGILDVNIPMAYLKQCQYESTYQGWMDLTKENQFNRQAIIGPGTYLETLDQAISQMKETRAASAPGGMFAAGQCMYSYASPYASDCAVSSIVADPAGMATYLSHGTPTDPVPMYPSVATLPAMPRLTNGKGHLMGTVRDLRAPSPGWIDGATVSIIGPTSRTIKTDGTGFYGFVDLPAGTYSVTVTATGIAAKTKLAVVTAANVASSDFNLPAYTLADAARALKISAGLLALTGDDVRYLNAETTGSSANTVDTRDAVRIARKAFGPDTNI